MRNLLIDNNHTTPTAHWVAFAWNYVQLYFKSNWWRGTWNTYLFFQLNLSSYVLHMRSYVGHMHNLYDCMPPHICILIDNK